MYRNRTDGTRSVRYRGKNEAFAVSELLTRLKAEIRNQKSHNGQAAGSGGNTFLCRHPELKIGLISCLLVLLVGGINIFSACMENEYIPRYNEKHEPRANIQYV